MSNSVIGSVNEGYIITSYTEHNGVKFVLGENIVKGDFVTWMSREDDDYFWGHYFSNYQDAFKDLMMRSKDAFGIDFATGK